MKQGSKELGDKLMHYKTASNQQNCQLLYFRQQGACYLGQSLGYCKNLKIIKLTIGSYDSIGSAGLKQISQGMKYFPNLNSIYLYIGQFNNLNAEGFTNLFKNLQQCEKFHKLFVQINSGNNVGNDGAIQIAQSFQNCLTLDSQSLTIGWQQKNSQAAKKCTLIHNIQTLIHCNISLSKSVSFVSLKSYFFNDKLILSLPSGFWGLNLNKLN
ncbi:hypothetical protein ABPG72_003315 [Tetrahymena utriculariae]